MKPVTLTMTAFGPYADSQTIDFTSLNQEGIFLITGPTGSGKSSIFDAIVFSLYGETSGSIRESGSLRSQYAAPDAICQVEFTFLLREKQYTIRRQPRQQRQSRRGDSMTQITEKAELIFPDGSVLTGSRNVDERIVELSGIQCSQFKQIAMLAQGEFRRLLDAPSSEKQEIFRNLFSTQFYDEITKQLETEAKLLENSAKEQRRNLEQLLASAQLPNFDDTSAKPEQALEKQIQTDQETILSLNKHTNILMTRREQLHPEEAETLNRQFEALALDEKRLSQLAERQPEIERMSACLERYRSTSELRIIAQKLKIAEDSLLRAQEEQKQAAKQEADIQKALQSHLSTIEQLPSWNEKVHSLSSQTEQLVKLQEIARQLEQNEKDCQKISDNLQNVKRQYEVTELLARRAELLHHVDDIAKAVQDWDHIMVQQSKRLELLSLFRKQKNLYLSAYNLFMEGQAAVLAGKLQDNIPCPVCGSLHHPAPAAASRNIPTQQQVEALQKQSEDTLETGRQHSEMLTKNLALFSDSLSTLQNDKKVSITREMLDQEPELLIRQKEELTDLQYSVNLSLDPIEQQILALGGEKALVDPKYRNQEEIDQKLRHLTQDQARLESTLESLKRQHEQFSAQLDENDTAPALAKQLDKLRQEQRTLENDIQQANIFHARLSQQAQSAKQNLSAAAARQKIAQEQLLPIREEFQSQLLQNGYQDIAAFKTEQASFSREEMENLASILEKHREEQNSLKSRIAILRQQLEGKQPADLESIRTQAAELDNQLAILRQQQIDCSARLKLNSGLHSRIIVCQKQLSRLDDDYAQIGELARIAGGNNAKRLSFERYVLAAYFDSVIRFANLRLSHMTNDRYSLQRREEREKNGRASGLDLDVFDSYTGQTRHVSTLSGGESFQAALALALGLADVTGMFAGGISMDTIFIDEGFGSLDPMALDSAISALTTLSGSKNGKTVGVVSHVEALKERISHKIVVTPSHNGSTLQVL